VTVRRRRITALLGAAALMLAAAPIPALAQEDPGDLPPLSSTVPDTGQTTSTTPPPPPPAQSEPPSRVQELPNTGSDPRVLALLGAALLLAGIGLRMRAPDGRF
jgi:LPXTG-motif cell wall-anchored protein